MLKPQRMNRRKQNQNETYACVKHGKTVCSKNRVVKTGVTQKYKYLTFLKTNSRVGAPREIGKKSKVFQRS